VIRRHPLSSDVPPVRNRGELPKDSSIAFAIGLKYDVRAIPGPDGKAIASFERDAPQGVLCRRERAVDASVRRPVQCPCIVVSVGSAKVSLADEGRDGEVRHDGGIAGDLEALANAQVVGLWTTRNHFAL